MSTTALASKGSVEGSGLDDQVGARVNLCDEAVGGGGAGRSCHLLAQLELQRVGREVRRGEGVPAQEEQRGQACDGEQHQDAPRPACSGGGRRRRPRRGGTRSGGGGSQRGRGGGRPHRTRRARRARLPAVSWSRWRGHGGAVVTVRTLAVEAVPGCLARLAEGWVGVWGLDEGWGWVRLGVRGGLRARIRARHWLAWQNGAHVL